MLTGFSFLPELKEIVEKENILRTEVDKIIAELQ